VPAYSIVPRSEIQDEEKAKARVIASGAAGAVVLRLVGTQQEISASSAQYFTPMYSGMWGGYWGYGWGGVYDPGYLKTENILHVETLVYSVDQNKLLWAGQSKSTNPKNVDGLIKDLVGKVADEMKKAGLVKKGS